MRFFQSTRALGPVLGMAMLLAGCSAYDQSTAWVNRRTSSVFEGVAWAGDKAWAPWGSTRPVAPGAGQTVQRVFGDGAVSPPLMPEDGNVWPEREAPRATLMNPDQALRGIPSYAPTVPSPTPAEAEQPASRSQRRGSGGPFVPAPANPPAAPGPQSAAPSPAALSAVAAPALGQAMPGGITPATSTGNVATFNEPGRGTGTVTRDGNSVIISRPGETPVMQPAPR